MPADKLFSQDCPDFLTPAEVALRWRITPRAVRLMAHRGELVFVVIGGRMRVKSESVRAYETAHFGAAKAGPPG